MSLRALKGRDNPPLLVKVEDSFAPRDDSGIIAFVLVHFQTLDSAFLDFS